MTNLFKRIFRKRPAKEEPMRAANPEAGIKVSFDNESITVTRPNGPTETVKWDELEAVIIETNETGPFGIDLYWILFGEGETGAVFPGGATGEEEILKEMQERLDDFDNETFIVAMSSIDNNKFLLWKRESGRI